ncbi:XdhC family protein [Falsihalocynthiibacter sp. BN13B15]|uniref:XdhC family protein n=1 Tax=Falsihalocynthiibacter sp. BN13B15 TaxID=3240871 RepID=UPI00351049A6
MGISSHSFENRASDLRAQGQPFAIATVVRTVNATSAKPGSKAIILADGTITDGWVGGGCIRSAVRNAAKAALSKGCTQFISLRPEEILAAEGLSAGETREGVQFARNGCPSKGSMDIFVEPVLPQPELIVFGEGPVAKELVALAERFDFSVSHSVDGKHDFAAPTSGLLYVVIATQGNGDEAALRATIKAAPKFAAFVGSRRKFETLVTRLIASGVSQLALDQIKSPAGLNIGAITPDEIALSILSEVVLKRRELQRAKGDPDDVNC